VTLLLLTSLLALNAGSRIDTVIAYPDQAIIVRKTSLHLSGPEQLAFRDLTGSLDDNTVRLKAPGLRIGEVQVKPGYIASPTSRVKTLEDSLDRLRTQDQRYAGEQEVLKARETFLNSIKLGAPELMSKEMSFGKVDAGNWGTALGFMTTELVATKNRGQELDRTRKEMSKVINAVAQELSNARAASENRKAIYADVSVDEPGTYEVTLFYAVPYSVSWSPYYELRARPSDQQTEISYFARLSQRTNEDWDNVKVILSTGRPSAGGVAPEPQGWYLDIYTPVITYGEGAGKATRAVLAAPGAMMLDHMAEKKAEEPAQAVETGISLQYVIPGRVSLKSGEDAKKLAVYQTRLPSEFSYYSYPRIEQQAYLRGKLQNNTDYIFLAGQGNTYVGDEFTGKTFINSVAPGESADMSFGVDDRVKVKRELVKSLTSKTGMFGNRTRVEFTYKTTVENYHSKTVKLALIEQIPVSRNKDVAVNLVKLEPKPDETNKDNGTFKFNLELQPQQKLVVNLVYTVEYPTGKQVSGLY
jgi:uncharacterized protein (TIGR02231 family)